MSLNILFLDDMKERYLQLIISLTKYGVRDSVDIDWAVDVEQARRFMDSGKDYELIMFDHDLTEEHYRDLDALHTGTGREAVTHLIATQKPRRELLTVVHTWNTNGKIAMRRNLEEAGFRVHQENFGKSLCEHLAAGIQTVLSNRPS